MVTATGRGAGPLDAADCAAEPIHIIGHVQAFGMLVAVSEPDLVVHYVSDNVCSALGRESSDILGHSLDVVFGDNAAAVRAHRAGLDLDPVNPLRIAFGRTEQLMDCIGHRYNGLLLLELEPAGGSYSLLPLNLAQHVRARIARMQQETSVLPLAVVAAAEFQRASGYDRVIIYRFDSDWSGHVIAEAEGGSWPAYLGHHFPASDIPEQARRLFLSNPLRSIADVGSDPVRIVGAQGGSPLDLSLSLLRSASPVHIEYLRNMGVRATTTASIIVRGELWGMITAHHEAPHRLDFTTRGICGLLAQTFASRIAAIDDTAMLVARLTARDRIETYMSALEQSSRSAANGGSVDVEPILDLLHADGVIAQLDGAIIERGKVVGLDRLRPVIDVLRTRANRGVSSSSSLIEVYPEAASYAHDVSGALFMSISESGDEYIVVLRTELVETLIWAGDPRKSTAIDASGKLHPRASFASWMESVRGRSRAWTDIELESARALREKLIQVRVSQQRHKAEERVRYLAQFDVLTGLPNRSSIHDILDRDLARAIREHVGLAVLFVDLDRFKHFNDSLGHAAGDAILRVVASRMKQCIRGDDTIGRIGGDEFIAVMPGIKTEEQALLAASRLLAEIEKPFALEGSNVQITASIGMSRYPHDGASSDLLLKRSDVAMYRAKGSGGNALEVFEDS